MSDAKSRGNLVVLLYTIFVNFLRWSIGFYIMRPTTDENKEINKNNSKKIRQIDTRERIDSLKSNIKNNYLLNSQADEDNSRNVIQFDSAIDLSNRITNIHVNPSFDLSKGNTNFHVKHPQELVIIL